LIAVVDYGRGNLFSIGQALSQFGADFEITHDPERIRASKRIILPGVGAFGAAIDDLRERNLSEPIQEIARQGKPLLGICLGMQLLCSVGEEFGEHRGLDLIPGRVVRLPESKEETRDSVRIPNVGWRSLRFTSTDPMFDDLADGTMVYFTHSYCFQADDTSTVSAEISINGAEIPGVVRQNNIIGYQFHPEKSGPTGLGFIRRFLESPLDHES
jgi:glutamine amidotransferase